MAVNHTDQIFCFSIRHLKKVMKRIKSTVLQHHFFYIYEILYLKHTEILHHINIIRSRTYERHIRISHVFKSFICYMFKIPSSILLIITISSVDKLSFPLMSASCLKYLTPNFEVSSPRITFFSITISSVNIFPFLLTSPGTIATILFLS